MSLRSDVSSLTRVRRTLNNALRDENYYMAHQLYKSLYTRFINTQDKNEAIKTLHEGVAYLLERHQINMATDLSQVFVKALSTQRYTPDDLIFDYVKDIFNKFGSSLAAERESMLNSVIQWTIEFCPEFPYGHPCLHKRIGYVYWSESNYTSAQYHYLRSSDGLGFAAMLVELHRTRGFKHEVDLFIAQVVLQGLCVRNTIIAQSTFQSYTKLHPAINDEPPYMLPLLNFLCFLLKILDSGKLKTYIVLCEQYQSSLIRDPSYTEYLDKIGQLFFNVKPIERRPRQQNGFLDEEIVSYLSRYSCKMFIKEKLVSFGFKLCCLTLENGYLFQFLLYGGASTRWLKDLPRGNLLSTLMNDYENEEEPLPSSSRPMDVEPLD